MTAQQASILGTKGARRNPSSSRERVSDVVRGCPIMTQCARGEEFCKWDGSTEYWYCVISGAARHCWLLPSGRRQIVDLLLPGDFGVCGREQRSSSLEAVLDGTIIALYPPSRLEAVLNDEPEVARETTCMALNAVARLQKHMLILGGTTATAKVASFLLHMDAPVSGERLARDLVLPMSRYDIADYLAISVETVSRVLTTLRQRGLIALSGTRRIKILNRGALDSDEVQDLGKVNEGR